MIETLEQQWSDLLFGVRRSIRYHSRRQMFFDHLHSFIMTGSVISGSATFFTVLSQYKTLAMAAGAAVTLFSTIDLVFGFSKMGRLHEDLMRRCTALEKEMVREREPTAESLADFTSKRLDIETDEPPIHLVLDSMCHNELVRAMGYDESEFVRIGWFQRLLANYVDICEHRISKRPRPSAPEAA
jgi:hypothetical protein